MFCIKCGTPVVKDADFCQKCGTKTSGSTSAISPPGQLSNRYMWLIVLIFGINATVPFLISWVFIIPYANLSIPIGLVSFIVLIILLIKDKKELEKSGASTFFWGLWGLFSGLLFYPIYLYTRVRRTNKKYGAFVAGLGILVISGVLAIFVGVNMIVIRYQSGSMLDTIQYDARIAGTGALFNPSLERFDIVIVNRPDGRSEPGIYRIIGLPGDTLEIKDGSVYVNDRPLSEPHAVHGSTGYYGPIAIPEDSYFVMGDNRANSMDSRYWDNPFVREDDIAKVTRIKNP